MAAAKASLQKYIASQTRLGRDIRRSAIFAALHVEGVQRVELAFSAGGCGPEQNTGGIMYAVERNQRRNG
ncbi:Baseplate assembly protein GpJ [Escherichia coli]|nr:Baseplate assembly protein GpJ [Escherichia coli]